MKDSERYKKEPKKLYGREQAHFITEIMICFIGICMILLAFLSLTGQVPKEYAFGATLAGFCFVYADFFILEEKVSGKDLVTYGIFLFLGVLSFILLPVVLLIGTSLGNLFMSESDFFTFMAFGIVLITMGYKTTVVRRQEHRTKISSGFEELQEELNAKLEENTKMLERLEWIEEELARVQSLASDIGTDDK
ncbi:hypothetical protein [Sporosarcina psychrophila]|uniref:Uncharacterized protein n=1 Tax=Sporosarcina psychrophila TaxID=1476 RepID=A0ABV2K9U1_SPOPS